MNFSDWAMFEKGRMLNMMTAKISATYAAKVSQATIKHAAAKPKTAPRAASKNQSDSEKNRAKLAAVLNK